MWTKEQSIGGQMLSSGLLCCALSIGYEMHLPPPYLTSPEMRPDPVQWWTTCGSLCQSVADQIISHVEDEPKSGSEDDYYTVEHENELWIIVIINLWVLLVLAPLLDPMDH